MGDGVMEHALLENKKSGTRTCHHNKSQTSEGLEMGKERKNHTL